MNMNLKEVFYNKLPSDKIKINWNKNLVRMDLFLSFLTVETIRSFKHSGSDTGWTLLLNEDLKLKIGGGVVNGVEYLNDLQFGLKLSNPYNNFVNPFFLFEILTKEGQLFFIEYYKGDIDKLKTLIDTDIMSLEAQLKLKNQIRSDIKEELERLF